MNRWHFIFVAILVAGGGWLLWSQVPDSGLDTVGAAQPAINQPAPALTLPVLGGETFSLADLEGKPVVLNFWATWCVPCRAEMPMLQATWERYGEDVAVIGVDLDEDATVVQGFVDKLQITFPILLDKGSVVAERYNVLGLPTTVFIDGDGVIRHIYPGQLHSAILAEGIDGIVR